MSVNGQVLGQPHPPERSPIALFRTAELGRETT
jgi:hypothetical protein